MKRIFLGFTFVLLLGSAVIAQGKDDACRPPFKYENRNQIDPKPLEVSIVSGRIVAEVGELGGTARQVGPVPAACVALFSDKDNRLIATASANDDGRFSFDTVQPGKYRLVVRSGALCVANIPLRVVSSKRKSAVVVHMRPAGYDDCSYGDYR